MKNLYTVIGYDKETRKRFVAQCRAESIIDAVNLFSKALEITHVSAIEESESYEPNEILIQVDEDQLIKSIVKCINTLQSSFRHILQNK